VRISAKAGEQPTIKLDKRETKMLLDALDLCELLEQHGEEAIFDAAKKSREALTALVGALNPPEEEPTT
jgi:hypothetical protein